MKQLFWIVLIAVTLWLPRSATAVAQEPDAAVVRAVLFMSPTCGHCHYVITEVLQPMAEAYGNQLEILTIDVSHPEGSQLYNQAVRAYEIAEDRRGVPTLIIGDVILVGSGEIPAQFPELVVDGLATGGIPWPDFPGLSDVLVVMDATPEATTVPATPTPVATFSSPMPSNEVTENKDAAVYLAYFYDPTCLECAQVSNELAYLQAEYPNLVVHAYNLHEEAALNEALCEKYGIPTEKRLLAPAGFIGSQCLTSGEITQDHLSSLIQNPEPAAMIPPWEGLEGSQSTAAARLVARFQEIGVLAVAGAGLLDGVNPCAFTTIVFFVSYLALVGRRGREVLFVGAAFTVAVFLTYLAMG